MTNPKDPALFEALDRRFKEKQDANRIKYAAFSLPIKEGIIYLATRNTPPFLGKYSVIGGKLDQIEADPLGGSLSSSSIRLAELRFERPTVAAVREYCEEMYSSHKFPEDFDLEEFRIAPFICINDVQTGVSCYTRIIIPPVDLSFNPSPREIGVVRELQSIDPTEINPLTKLVLRVMKQNTLLAEYHAQIPSLEQLAVTCAGPIGDHYLLDY